MSARQIRGWLLTQISTLFLMFYFNYFHHFRGDPVPKSKHPEEGKDGLQRLQWEVIIISQEGWGSEKPQPKKYIFSWFCVSWNQKVCIVVSASLTVPERSIRRDGSLFCSRLNWQHMKEGGTARWSFSPWVCRYRRGERTVEARLGLAVISRWTEFDFQSTSSSDAVTKMKSSCCLQVGFNMQGF